MKKYSEKYFRDNFRRAQLIDIPPYIKTDSIKLVIQKVDDVDTDIYLSQQRVGDDVTSRAHSLSISFESGIDWNEPLPIIRLRKDGSKSLIDAFGRFQMFDDNGHEWWIMIEVECNAFNEWKLRNWANRQKYRAPSSRKDNIEALKTAVRKGFIKNPTLRNLTIHLNGIEPHKPKEEKKEILSVLVDLYKKQAKPKKVRFLSWATTSIQKKWISRHFADAKKLGFKLGSKGKPMFSKISNCYYGIMVRTYEARKLLQAINYNLKKDVPLKVLGLSKDAITSKKKLKAERSAIRRNLTKLTNSLDEIYKKYNGNVPWEKEVIGIVGFVPEDVNEDIKEPVNYKPV